MFNRSNCDRNSQLSGILTGPFDPLDCDVRLIISQILHGSL